MTDHLHSNSPLSLRIIRSGLWPAKVGSQSGHRGIHRSDDDHLRVRETVTFLMCGAAPSNSTLKLATAVLWPGPEGPAVIRELQRRAVCISLPSRTLLVAANGAPRCR